MTVTHQDIALAAYYRAEAEHFAGDPTAHWLLAEAELKKGLIIFLWPASKGRSALYSRLYQTIPRAVTGSSP